MSLGLAAVERGFNISNSDLRTNVSPGVIAKRLVEDHLLANNLKPHTIQIMGSLLKQFNSLIQNGQTHLKNRKEKAKDITSDIKNLKRKVKTNQYRQCLELSEKKRDSTLPVKGNRHTRKCDQVKEEMKTTEQDICALEAKKKKLFEK